MTRLRYEYELKLDPERLEDSIPGHFTVIVHNKGKVELPIKLFASDERQRASYRLMPSVLRVPAGGKARSQLLVVPTELSAFLRAIKFTVQDSFGKSVKGEYLPEFEEEDEDEEESDSSEQEAQADAEGGRDGGSGEQRGRIEEGQRRSMRQRGRQRNSGRSGREQVSRSDAPTRVHPSARPRQPRQRRSFGGRGSGISLPVDTTIRVLMGMAAFLLVFLVIMIAFWLWPEPSLVMSQPPEATETIEPTVTEVSVSIPSPTATPPPIPTTPIPTVTLRTQGSETQNPTEIPVEASFTPTDTPVEGSQPTNTPALAPTNIPIQRSRTPVEGSLPTNTPVLAPTDIPIQRSRTPIEVILTATNTPVEVMTPTNTPIRASLTPTNTPVRVSLTPTETPARVPITPTNTRTLTIVPPSETPTLTTAPPTETPTAAPPTDTPTSTSVPPTDTPTSTAAPPTNTPISTAVPPTDTPTSTAAPPTDTPTSTAAPPTDTPTSTAVPPTDTPTVTPSLTPQVSFPDLVIRSLEVTGRPVQDDEGRFQVPIVVIVYNQGESASDIFKVAIEATQTQGTFVVPFTVKGQSSIWYPFTAAPLPAGSRVLFEGTVSLNSSPSGEIVTLTAIADSCSSDEFMPDYCRVEESDEQNNRSAPATVRLPGVIRNP